MEDVFSYRGGVGGGGGRITTFAAPVSVGDVEAEVVVHVLLGLVSGGRVVTSSTVSPLPTAIVTHVRGSNPGDITVLSVTVEILSK